MERSPKSSTRKHRSCGAGRSTANGGKAITSAYEAPEVRREAIVDMMYTLAKFNQCLDWEIPSEMDQRMQIAEIIDRLERLRGPSPAELVAAEAAKKAWASLSCKPIRRGHLTLVWSRE